MVNSAGWGSGGMEGQIEPCENKNVALYYYPFYHDN